MYYYKNCGYYKTPDGRYYTSIDYNAHKNKRQVKKAIKQFLKRINKDSK